MSDFLANMSNKKANSVIQKYYEENLTESHLNSDDIKKTLSGLTAEEVDNILFAGKSDYADVILEKNKDGLGPEIVLAKGQSSFNIVFYSDTNYYDIKRPQAQISVEEKRKIITTQLKKVNKNEKTIIVFGGDLIGEEWTLATLRNAAIVNTKVVNEITTAVSKSKTNKTEKDKIIKSIETFEESEDKNIRSKVARIVAYWGIKKRTAQLRNDIRTYYSIADKLGLKDYEIILMNGAEEVVAKEKFNLDILDKVYNELKDKFANIYYANNGLNVLFPVFANNKSANCKHISLNIQTNSKTKATNAKSVANASVIANGPSDSSACFRLNVGNFSGFYKGIYYPTGQSLVRKSAKGNFQERAPHNRDVYHIDITGNEKCEVTRGGSPNPKAYALEEKIKIEQLKKECIIDVLSEITSNMVRNIVEKGE